MQKKTWSERLWGAQAKLFPLLIAAVVLLLGMLGGREIWTQEHRWADIVQGMFYYHDFLHPMLEGSAYYDKPLLSYWLISGLSVMTGKLSLWSLRFPSALAGLLAVWSIYRLGTTIKNKQMGLLAGWLLLTTFYFVFWARVSSADMLNMAGTLFAVTWYMEKRDRISVFNYAVFFSILAVTALCKGLVGPVVAGIAILPDLILQRSFKKHLNWRLLAGLIPGVLIYAVPFWASSHFGSLTSYQENGLMLVYRENVLRYFQPFDHKGPIYTYLIYLPIYTLPWAFLFIPALLKLKARWKTLNVDTKWLVWATALIFLFFTLSGSRRSYYVLPMVPFAILLTADWILSGKDLLQKRYTWAVRITLTSYLVLMLAFVVIQPLYYSHGGAAQFATRLQTEANKTKPWSEWQFVMLDANSKERFYLQLSPDIKNPNMPKGLPCTVENVKQTWPILNNLPKNTIIITKEYYAPVLQTILKHYKMVEPERNYLEMFSKKRNPNTSVAFIPENV